MDAIVLTDGRLHRFLYHEADGGEQRSLTPLHELMEHFDPYILFVRQPPSGDVYYDACRYAWQLAQDERGIHARVRRDLSAFLTPVGQDGIPDFSKTPHFKFPDEMQDLFQEQPELRYEFLKELARANDPRRRNLRLMLLAMALLLTVPLLAWLLALT